jgi:hexokinase
MGPMAVNLESGNFHPPCLSPFDDRLDAGREDAGQQRLEKAVSGRFLPQLFSYISTGRTGPPYPDTREIFERAGDPEAEGSETARLIVNRSADLAAAALAGLIDTLETGKKIGILGEGGVINKNPEYRDRIHNRLAALLGDDPGRPGRFGLLHRENVNLFGAAAAVG